MRINYLILKSSLLCLLLVAAQQVLAQSPGGVTGALMWVRADSGMTKSGAGPSFSITGWTNQANPLKNLKPFGTPTVSDTANVNFNPAAIFNGSSSLYSDSIIETASSNHTRFVVFKSNVAGVVNIIGSGKPVAPVADAANVLMQPGGGGFLQQWVAGSSFYGNTAAITISRPQLAASRYAAGVANGTYIRVNGVSNIPSTNTVAFLGNRVQLGAAYNVGGATNVNYLNGTISEVAIYGSALSATEIRQVESYLALKYGLTISGDYLASNSTVIWNSSAHAGFLNNIAGIGRDSTSDLLQKQSRSVNNGFQPIVALNTIASTNKLNTSTALSAADRSFLIWGDNNGATTFATAITLSGINNRMARVWKVQETGTVGTVLVAIPASSVPSNMSNVSLLTAAASTFSTGVTAIAMSLQTIGGVQYYTASINLTDGQFFTFGGLTTSPGGVAGETLWLKADALELIYSSGTTINGTNRWTATTGNSAGQYVGAGTAPTFVTGSWNFNPSVRFNLGGIGADFVNTGNAMTTFLTVNYGNSSGSETSQGVRALAFAGGAVAGTANQDASTIGFIGAIGSPINVLRNPSSVGLVSVTSSSNPGIITGMQTPATGAASGNTASTLYGLWNGALTTTATSSSGAFGINYYAIGAYADGGKNIRGDGRLNGLIPEVIVYSNDLTSQQRSRVNSYLAIKYGITQGSTASAVNYLSSSGTTTWTGSSTYQNSIAGIGRDDSTGLYQKQGISVNSGAQVVMALGAAATTNLANVNTFSSNAQFFIWGDDAASITNFTSTGNSTFPYRFTRVWKTQNTNSFAQDITVYYPVSAFGNADVATINLLYGSSAASLSSGGGSMIAQSGTSTINSVSYYKFAVPAAQVANMQFFSFTLTATTPGGVAGLRLWLRADKGTSTTTEGATLDTLRDQSGNNFNAYAPTAAANKPLFRAGNSAVGKDFNFNPYLDMTISGVNKRGLYNTAGIYTSNNDNGAQFAYALHSGTVTASGTTLMAVGNGTIPGAVSYMDQSKVYFTSSTDIQWVNTSIPFAFAATVSDINLKPALYSADWTGATSSSKVLRFMSEGRRRGTSPSTTYFGWASGVSNQFAINDAYASGFGDNAGSLYASEYIMYNTTFSDLDLARVNSYMSLKYGTTMSQNLDGDATLNEIISGSIREGDYVASDGSTVFWTANSSYNTCIAGIGRDALSDLEQKQSKSIESGNQVVMSLGTVQATNALNTNTFTGDKQFLVWAHDGNSDSTIAATGNSSYPKRFTRIWKTQNTNSFAQDIRVYYPVVAFGNTASSAVALLYGSTAASLSSGAASAIVQSDTITINGARYYEFAVPAATVPSLQFFSFTAFTTSPGGVSDNLGLWYKADAGITKTVDSVDQWDNVSGSGLYNLTAAATANRPRHGVDSGYINFNPSLSFDGVNDQIVTSSMPHTVVTQGSGTYGNSQYIVYRSKTSSGYAYGHSTISGAAVAANTGSTGSMWFVNNARNTLGPLYNEVRMQGLDGNTASARAYQNGSGAFGATAGTLTGTYGSTPFCVGNLSASSSLRTNADIAEIIIYNDSLNTRRRRVESYLAIKYGISIDQVVVNNAQNYVSSTGKVIWPTSTIYTKNVFGIGRDDLSGLHQQISTSTTRGTSGADSLLLSTDNNFTNANGTHTTLPTDTSFLLIGHNNGSFNVNTSILGLTAVNTRTARVWRVIENGVVPAVYLRAKGVTAPYMVVSADSTFSSGVTVVPVSGEVTSYNFPTGTSYIAFAQLKKAPGSVTDDYLVWYQANSGISTGTTFVWTDQFSSQTATQTISSKQPTLDSTTNRINFNPVLRFDGTDDRLQFTSITGVPFGLDSVVLYYVARNNALGSAGLAYHQGLTTGSNTAFLSGKSAANSIIAGTVVGGSVTITGGWSPVGKVNLIRAGYEGGTPKAYYVAEEGKSVTKGSNITPAISTNNPTIGARNDSTQHWNGDISELILYSDNHNGKNSSVQIESYLAVKYGITLGSKSAPVSYLNTAGNVTWTGSSTYQAHVIGLGRDTITDLDQRITSSTDAGDVLTLSMDNNFTANNLQHSGITNNLSFLMVGNDSASVSTFITTEKPAAYSSRIPREWRVQTTNFSQTVNLRFTGFGSTTAAEWYLLKKNGSSDFTSGATEVVKLNANGDATGITLNNDDYFTLMRKNLIDCIMVNPRVTNRLKVP